MTGSGDAYVVAADLVRHRTTAADGSPGWGHGLVWSFIDVRRRSHAAESWVDRGAVDAFRAAAAGAMDARVRAALLEALAAGLPVAPDRLLPDPVRVGPGPFDIGFGAAGTLYEEQDGGRYGLTLRGERAHCDLVFSPVPGPASAGTTGDATYAPRYAVAGRVGAPGTEGTIDVSGEGWIETGSGEDRCKTGRDEERCKTGRGDGRYPAGPGGGPLSDELPAGTRDIGRQRLTVLLDDGWRVTAESVDHVDVPSRAVLAHQDLLTAYAPDGRALPADDARCRSAAPWTSLATLNTYPTTWTVTSEQLRLRLDVTAHFPGQEVRTMLAGHGFLCAAARVAGTRAGRAVTGWALVSAVPAQRIGDLEEYLGRLHKVTRREVRRLYPDRPSSATTRSLLGGTGASLDGFTDTAVHQTLVRPVRHLTDPGGRGWRTYVCCAAIELVGVRADPYTPLLAAVEVIHSANLAIDDVQDGSLHRRGVSAVHRVFGVPATVNAATAAYFALDRVIDDLVPADDGLKLAVCRTYLRTLRAAHGGQALDLAGHTEEMDAAVATGDPRPLLRRLRAAHRFKTGVPARGFAELGALVARADGAQRAAIGAYFEAVGTAYQISDDVLDLLGATAPQPSGSSRKHTGEDLRSGTVTMPLAHCVALLPADRVRLLWKAVRDGGADADTVHGVATAIARSGAVQACQREARALVDDAWRTLAPLLPASLTKILVRALGTYAALREPEPPAAPAPRPK
ncbi:polyprenyl synthetase family protein [Streptomyces inhibens]|uniref:polyprenyl synthetase family protein n=1 Tax=Streptomyces inhibens TaxID=2293571 RepID=UPI001EE70D94|nr:polyprenyl synthetase family protein [Streptomyces inhibens]UKY48764.1 polyprenyl synthetase family protein [Streptomyces inhibens]